MAVTLQKISDLSTEAYVMASDAVDPNDAVRTNVTKIEVRGSPGENRDYLAVDIPQARGTGGVYVDWGDGAVDNLSDSQHELYFSGDNYRFTLHHLYATDGVYVVTLFGDVYVGVHGAISPWSRVVRALESDLPLAQCVRDISYLLARNSSTRIDVAAGALASVTDVRGLFFDSPSLRTVTGLSPSNLWADRFMGLFEDCTALVETDFRLPSSAHSPSEYAGVFRGAAKLAVPLASLLPLEGFLMDEVSFDRTFYETGKSKDANQAMPVSDTAKAMLWEGTTRFTDTASAFTRSGYEWQVPASWGGTGSEPSKPGFDMLGDDWDMRRCVAFLMKKMGATVSNENAERPQ